MSIVTAARIRGAKTVILVCAESAAKIKCSMIKPNAKVFLNIKLFFFSGFLFKLDDFFPFDHLGHGLRFRIKTTDCIDQNPTEKNELILENTSEIII